MEFPFGESIIFLMTLVTWAQRHPSRSFYLALSLAWLAGRVADSSIIWVVPWHWNYARIAVILVFWWFAWQKAQRHLTPLLLTIISLALVDLFLVNEPGILQYDQWIFAGVCFLIAWLASLSYWGMAAAVAGSAIVNLGLVPFVFGGIVGYVDLPNEFLWNFGVLTLTSIGLIKIMLRGQIRTQRPEAGDQIKDALVADK